MLINHKDIWWCCQTQLSWHHDNLCFSVQSKWSEKMEWNLNSQKTPHTSPSGNLWDVFWVSWRKNDCYNNSRPCKLKWIGGIKLSCLHSNIFCCDSNMSQLTFSFHFQITHFISYFRGKLVFIISVSYTLVAVIADAYSTLDILYDIIQNTLKLKYWRVLFHKS